jgi:rhamnosyltransferase
MIGKPGEKEFNSTGQSIGCSVVIRAYNEEKHIGRLMTGLTQQTIKDLEIILVDSGSTDKTIPIAAAISDHYPFKVVHISPKEFTFGYSLNQGIEEANGEFIVIASAHVYPVYPDWIERLLEPFNDPQVGLTYGKQRGNAFSPFSENQIFKQWYPELSQPHQNHPFCNNANATIRRNLWQVHPFDQTLSGLEDVAWGKWAVETGYTISYVSDAEVIHVHDEGPRAVLNRYKREAMSFKRIFPEERFKVWDFIRLFSSNCATDIRDAFRQGVLLTNLEGIFWFRFMQFWGTYQGFRHSGPLSWDLRQRFYYPGGKISSTRADPRQIEPIRYKDAVKKT